MNTIKDYYVEIQKLYNSSLKMLTALNSSLISQSATVPLTILDDDSTETIYNIPSFLYLENKMLQMQETMDQLISLPKSGEAWFQSSDDTYRISMVSAANAPGMLYLDPYSTPSTVSSENSLFKDMVFPKLSLRCRISALSPDISQIAYKKVVFYKKETFDLLRKSSSASLSEINANLALFSQGTDYDVYEAVTELPLRSRDVTRQFSIKRLLESSKLQTYGTYTADNCDNPEYFGKQFFDVEFDSISYSDEADPSRIRTLKPGMTLQASRGYAKIVLEDVDPALQSEVQRDNLFRLVVTSGILDMHLFDDETNLSWSEAYDTYLVEDNSWTAYTYIDIPLEENPYICVFIAAIRNNIRSAYTSGQFYDLTQVYMVDDSGNTMVDENNKPITYIDYYKKFAKNAGDAIMSLVTSSEAGLESLTKAQLESLMWSDTYKPYINSDDITVTAINTHLSDDTILDEIKTLHVQKSELSSELETVRGDIQNIMSSLANTDFSKQQDTTRAQLQIELNDLYAKRTNLEKQIISVVNDINTRSNASVIPVSDIKYRLRGHISTSALEAALAEDGVSVAGLDIQYKYKSVSKDTTVASAINSQTFTSWNRYPTEMRPRTPYFENNNLVFAREETNLAEDSIKWNQLDIPIQQGEDVIVRVRAIYTAGQPFLNLYSPWSDEVTFEFPVNFTVNADIQSILNVNKQDTNDALITQKLIEDGYEEHVSNKIVDNDAIFYHQPENIASGFFTAEQKIISLREKLNQMSSDVDSVNLELENIKGLQYEVTLASSGKEIKLSPDVLNTLSLPSYLEHQEEAANRNFVTEELTVTIRNTGSRAFRLYSIFPGDQNKLLTNILSDHYMLRVGHYELYPVYAGTGWMTQRQGQWIYFRNTNPYTLQYDPVVMNDTLKYQSISGEERISGTEVTSIIQDGKLKVPMTILSSSKQLGFRYRNHDFLQQQYNIWGEIKLSSEGNLQVSTIDAVTLQNQANQKQGYWIPSSFAGRYDGVTFEQLRSQISEEVLKTWNSLSADRRQEYYQMYSSSDDSQVLSEFVNDYMQTMEEGWDLGLGYSLTSDLANVPGTASTDRVQTEGAFLFPNVADISTLLTSDSSSTSYLEIPVGQQVSIPVTFQFYLSEDLPTVSKYLYFDLRPSITQDSAHYMFKVTARYSESSTIMKNEETYESIGE